MRSVIFLVAAAVLAIALVLLAEHPDTRSSDWMRPRAGRIH